MNDKALQDNEKYQFKCYNCDEVILNPEQKYCPNCKIILNPNDLKWKYSFMLFLCFLCLTPIIVALIAIYFSFFM